MPVTTPVLLPIVATAPSVLVHTPPEVADASAEVAPTHIVGVPVITAGTKPTVITAVVRQPVGRAYVIFAVPLATPVTMPVEPTAAIDVLLLLQAPPVVVELKAVVLPMHANNVPEMAAAASLTVTNAVTVQPVLIV